MKARSAWFCLAAAFALIAVGLIAAVHIPRQAANAADVPAEAPVITNLPVSQISGVTLRMGEDAVGLIPSGTSFEVIGREDIVFDSSKLAALVYTACHLRADRRLSDPEPLSAYGLDAPRAKSRCFCRRAILFACSSAIPAPFPSRSICAKKMRTQYI